MDLEALSRVDKVETAELNRSRVVIRARGLQLKEEKAVAKNYKEMAAQVLDKVGGKENVTLANHCMTRLRLTLADKEKADVDAIKKINGVLGAQFSGAEFQVIIGQDVPKLYDAVCAAGNFAKQSAIKENLDNVKEPFSLKKIPENIMGALTGCLTPLLPALMVAGMFKMAVALFGDMLGLIGSESDLYRLLTFVGDAGFYFFPVMIGYTGAKKFGCSPMLGILMGGILLHPTLSEIVAAGEPFTVYGIPMTLTSYASSVIPMILITWVMSYIEKFFKKYVPDVLATVFTPLLTIVVMLPLALCVLGPLGAILSEYVISLLMAIHSIAGPLGVAIIGALYIPLVATGMHLPLVSILIVSMTTLGYDAIVMPGATVCIYAGIGVCLGFALKAKNAEDRGLGLSCLVAQALGGVGEPTIFGILFRYKKALAWVLSGSFCGSLVVGLLGAKVSVMAGASNMLIALGYGQDIVKGGIGCAIGFAVSFALMMIFGYEDKPSKA
ncbi:MAG: PTS transporter subunit EIIC [Oscillospiraceae bacterium]|nr:PTS transporter subunit EIIC [Oscillospiraceae bacterium]